MIDCKRPAQRVEIYGRSGSRSVGAAVAELDNGWDDPARGGLQQACRAVNYVGSCPGGEAVGGGEAERAWRAFEEYLRHGGYRVTLPRKLVLEHVFSRRDHFSADEAAAALHSGEGRVSRATVYTTLDLLVRAGLAHKLQDNHDRAHYEAARGELQHEHMICDTCGKFLEFSNRALSALIAQECRRYGFRQRAQRVVVFGTCKECARLARQRQESL